LLVIADSKVLSGSVMNIYQVTHSSGNHGLALAWASKIIGFPCTVIVPKGTPPCKIEAVKNLGAELIESYPSVTGRWVNYTRLTV